MILWSKDLLPVEAIGCTDIRTESREATPDEIPKDKPWCSWFYAVSGKLPDMEETNNE